MIHARQSEDHEKHYLKKFQWTISTFKKTFTTLAIMLWQYVINIYIPRKLYPTIQIIQMTRDTNITVPTPFTAGQYEKLLLSLVSSSTCSSTNKMSLVKKFKYVNYMNSYISLVRHIPYNWTMDGRVCWFVRLH